MLSQPSVISAIFILQYVCAQDVKDLIVNTKQGQVRGVPATDGDYSMYLGIPYAKVVESNPFGPSTPHPGFDEIFEANDDSHICPQVEEFENTIVGDLDCLRLNIFVPPTASPTNKLPVMVWIYGGGFRLGFYGRFLYGPKFLVRHDIIVVTVNYRLGPYGFMCLNTPEVPGNQGLKDQLLALRWLHENIEAFGGDPDKITISGNSAGSMSVDFHILRQNEGPKLFDKAILQSGTTFAVTFQQPLLDAPLLISDYLEFSTYNSTQALTFLATKDPLSVIEAVQSLGIAFIPCIEVEFHGVESFLVNNPVAATLTPTVKDMPIIIGFNNDEYYSAVAALGLDFSVADTLAARYDITHSDFEGMVDIVRHFYFGDEAIADSVQSVVDFGSDVSFIYPSIRSLKRFVQNEAERVYLYVFSYAGGRNFIQHKNEVSDADGAWHADEIGYLFDISYMEEPTPDDQLMIDRMTTMWANFVKSGDPTPVTSELFPHKWQPITKDSPRHYLEINTAMSTGISPSNERMSFWDFFLEVNGHLQLSLESVYVVE